MFGLERTRRSLPQWGVTIAFLLIVLFTILKLLQEGNTDPSSDAGSKIGYEPPPIKDIPANRDPSTVQFDVDYVQKNLESLDQADPQLIQFARVRYITPPSRLPYKDPEKIGSLMHYKSGIVKWVKNFFGNKRNGTFIEAGANKGSDASHTFHLERDLGWSGLLIECNPMIIPYLKTTHRKSWLATVCLAPTKTPGTLTFSNPKNWFYSGRLGKPWNLKPWNKEKKPVQWTFFDVETIPLYTLLKGIGLTEIDFFLFDVEGAELSILKTVPFDKIIFKVIIIEVFFYKEEEVKELDMLLVSNGYYLVEDLKTGEKDKVYIHDSVRHMLKAKVGDT